MVPETKSKIIEEGMESIKKVDKQYQEGLITSGERYNKRDILLYRQREQ